MKTLTIIFLLLSVNLFSQSSDLIGTSAKNHLYFDSAKGIVTYQLNIKKVIGTISGSYYIEFSPNGKHWCRLGPRKHLLNLDNQSSIMTFNRIRNITFYRVTFENNSIYSAIVYLNLK